MSESISEGDAIHSPRCSGSDFFSLSNYDITREVFTPFCPSFSSFPPVLTSWWGSWSSSGSVTDDFGLCSLLSIVKASASLILCSRSRSHLGTPLSVRTPSLPYPVSQLVLESFSLNDPQITPVSFVMPSLSYLA